MTSIKSVTLIASSDIIDAANLQQYLPGQALSLLSVDQIDEALHHGT